MTTLILDKSMVKAARKGVIKSLRSEFDFLLPGVLLQEIMTEKLDARQTLTANQINILDNKIHANMQRSTTEAGNNWIVENNEAIAWEIVKGCSAKYAPIMNVQGIPSPHMLSEKQKQECLHYDARKQVITAVRHVPEDQDWFSEIRKMGERELFTELSDAFSSDKSMRNISECARISYPKADVFRGLVVSPDFKPMPDWFSFGTILVSRVFLPWKFWKYGDEPSDTKKPANPFYDTMYIAAMAIADGIISGDKNLLKLAWACWPGKRGHIYDYDIHQHQIIPFEPKWSS